MQISEILGHLDGLQIDYEFVGDSSIEIDSANSLQDAMQNQFCYLNQSKLRKAVSSCRAGMLITQSNLYQESENSPIASVLLVKNAHYVFAKIMQLYYEQKPELNCIASSAVIDDTFSLKDNTSIEENAVIKEGVSIGEGCRVQSGAVIQNNVKIGDNCIIGSHVVIHSGCRIGNDVHIEAGAVIGSDGFGWANEKGRWHKIPQIGSVIIGDRVYIGSNCTVDRGAIGDTVIEDDVIIDNLVHIAHNVRIGQGSAMAAQVGFAGSTSLGKFNTIGGQAGFAGHLTTSDNCHFSARSGITHSINKSGNYSGFPAYDSREWQKNTVKSLHLSEITKEFKKMQKQLADLQAHLAANETSE